MLWLPFFTWRKRREAWVDHLLCSRTTTITPLNGEDGFLSKGSEAKVLRNLSKVTQPRNTRAEIWAQTYLFYTILHCLLKSVIDMSLIFSSTDYLNSPGFCRISSSRHMFSRILLMFVIPWTISNLSMYLSKWNIRPEYNFQCGQTTLADLFAFQAIVHAQGDFGSMVALSHIWPGLVLM